MVLEMNNTAPSPAPAEVAVAILVWEDQFLMQLRDDIPGIVYPGQWTFFGGHVDPGETPDQAIWRELEEEIGHRPPWLRRFQQQRHGQVIRHVYYGPLGVPLEQLILGEGWDLGLWTPAEIRQGQRYSPIAQQVRPMGGPHQALLLQFLEQSPPLEAPAPLNS